MDEIDNVLEIRNADSGEFIINGITYSIESLKQAIKEGIIRNPNYILKFYINDKVDFSVYFNLISKARQAVDELRNEYAMTYYSTEFENLDGEQMNITIDKYKFRIVKITNEMTKQLLN